MDIIYKYILTLLSGGIIWEGFKFFYPEIKNYFAKRKRAKEILFQNLDLAIKSADELFGKLESLTKEDFSTFINPKKSNNSSPEHNQIYVCYLIGQFWASLENIRLQSNYSSISSLKKGRDLIRFIETIESRKFRLLDRSKQRIIGESIIVNAENKFQIMSLYSFFDKIESDKLFSKWIIELNDLFKSSKNTTIRQRILVYGVIIAMFLEHFDSNHRIARKRNIYFIRLRPESLKLINNVLLKNYLIFIKNKKKYYYKKWDPRGC